MQARCTRVFYTLHINARGDDVGMVYSERLEMLCIFNTAHLLHVGLGRGALGLWYLISILGLLVLYVAAKPLNLDGVILTHVGCTVQ